MNVLFAFSVTIPDATPKLCKTIQSLKRGLCTQLTLKRGFIVIDTVIDGLFVTTKPGKAMLGVTTKFVAPRANLLTRNKLLVGLEPGINILRRKAFDPIGRTSNFPSKRIKSLRGFPNGSSSLILIEPSSEPIMTWQ